MTTSIIYSHRGALQVTQSLVPRKNKPLKHLMTCSKFEEEADDIVLLLRGSSSVSRAKTTSWLTSENFCELLYQVPASSGVQKATARLKGCLLWVSQNERSAGRQRLLKSILGMWVFLIAIFKLSHSFLLFERVIQI